MSTTEPNEPVNDTSVVNDSGSSDPATIEADIARHREELSATVDELTDRLDVKKQAKRRVSDVKTRVQQPENAELATLTAQALAVVAGVAAVAGAIWWWRR